MTHIKACWQEIENCGNRLGQCGTVLSRSKNTITTAKHGLSWQLKMQTNFDNRLEALNTRLTNLQRCLTNLQNAATNAARMYRDTELRLRGENETSSETADESGLNWWDLLGGAGIFGEAVSGIADFVNSDDPFWVSLPSAIGSMLGIGEGIASIVENGGANWFDELFGFANVADDIDVNGNIFSQLIGDEIDGYMFAGDGSTSSTLGSIAQWFGVITAGVTSGYSNWQEFRSGAIDADRAIGEFVIEAGADLLIGAGAEMLVTAALVAACGGAPAIVVGAGTALVTWAVDEVSESFFGVSATEAISDAVMDGVEWVSEHADDIKTTITEGIDTGVRWLGDRLDDAGEFFSDAFNGFGRNRARGGGGGGGGFR